LGQVVNNLDQVRSRTSSWTHLYPTLLGRELSTCSSRGSSLRSPVTSIVIPNNIDKESPDVSKYQSVHGPLPALALYPFMDIPISTRTSLFLVRILERKEVAAERFKNLVKIIWSKAPFIGWITTLQCLTPAYTNSHWPSAKKPKYHDSLTPKSYLDFNDALIAYPHPICQRLYTFPNILNLFVTYTSRGWEATILVHPYDQRNTNFLCKKHHKSRNQHPNVHGHYLTVSNI